jgi:hypothetical protein
VIVLDCIFEGSYAGSHRSASTFAAVGDSAVVVQSGATTQFINCIFTRYTAHHGGAVAVVGKSSAHFDNCIFSENVEGGAVYVDSGSAARFDDSTFKNNSAAVTGVKNKI